MLLDFRAHNFVLVPLYTAKTDSQERTARTGHPEQDRQNRTGRTGQAEKGQAEQDSQNMTVRTGQTEQDWQNKTALAEFSPFRVRSIRGSVHSGFSPF